jgi:hypothetical protein
VRAKVRRTRNVYVPESGWRGIGWLLPVAAAVAILALATVRFQNVGGTGIPGTVEGLPVMSVSEVLSERASGALTGGSVAVGGFWSSGVERLACAPAPDAGELEITCYDGQYGITEFDEAIFATDRSGDVRIATGPHLTPFVSDEIAETHGLFALPVINGQRYPPVPIVIVGHFGDRRADTCPAAAKQLCLDRLVVERIPIFDPGSVATPVPSPTPTPFPSPAPKGLFDPKAPSVCAGDVEYSFVGWTTAAELKLRFEREGHVWAAVTAIDVLLGGEEWLEDQATGQKFRWWGHRICLAEEGKPDVILYDAVQGTTYMEWLDGSTTKADLP